MINTTLFRPVALALLSATCLSLSHAQVSKVRVKVNADLNAQPDRELGLAKTVYGDAGSFVALKTLGGKRVIGGVTDADLGWRLFVIDSKTMVDIKHDKPKFVWGIGPVAMETIETFNKEFRVILSKPDNGKLLLLEQVLSSRSLTGRAAAQIGEVPFDLFGKGPEYFKPGMAVGFTTTLSGDGKHMLIGIDPSTTVRSAGCPILGVMVDSKMQPIWTKKLDTESGNVRTEVVSTQVDKNGSAWYLIKNVNDADPKAADKVGYSYSLYRLDSLGQQAFPLDLGKKDFVQEANFAFLPNGKIACAGVYSNGEASRNESVGTFSFALNPEDGTWTQATKTPFNLQVVKKVERLQTNMRMEHVWPMSDGGVFVVTVRSGIETHQVSDLSGKKFDKTEWVNGAFHVMQLDADGAVKWYTEVPREMSFTNDGPGKAFSIAFSDVLYLFYNDAVANIELRKKNTPVDPVDKPKDALMLEFKEDGGYKEKLVMKDGFKQGYFDADQVWSMGNGLFGLEGAPDFRKDRTFPVLIEMSDGGRR